MRQEPSLLNLARDLKGLVTIHAVLLAVTLVCGNGNRYDLQFQSVYLLFLVPGWLLGRRWTPLHQPLIVQYAHALITAFSLHGVLVLIGTWFQLSTNDYFTAFALVMAASVVDRGWSIASGDRPRSMRMTKEEVFVWLALLVFIAVVYRIPRSNDIGQFIAQQQDYVVTESLAPSAIGVSGMGVDEAMPRWRANFWHLWPSLMAVCTRLSLQDVLHRYATIPLALAAFVCLVNTMTSLTRQPRQLWAIVLAIIGPILIWYRGYNAFTYSFRITNNFALDKDFCLFFLIPAIVYLATGWLRGKPHFLIPLLLSVPAIVRFHPMTAVYLTLLLPFVVVGFAPIKLKSLHGVLDLSRITAACLQPRSLCLCIATLFILATVVWLGDAQSFHREIHEILRLDFIDYQAGRPLHYWVGHYGSIPELDQRLDTSIWTNGRFHLRWAIIFDSGLFLVAHLAWAIGWIASRRIQGDRFDRSWLAIGISLAMVWLIVLSSYVVLDRYRYLLAGMERLHWFAFLPALLSVSMCLAVLGKWIAGWIGRSSRIDAARRSELLGAVAVISLLLYSAGCMAMERSTIWVHVRGIHSRLDYELSAFAKRRASYNHHARRVPKPDYLHENDRVLFLEPNVNRDYWLMKQSIFWSEPYAEAFVLHHRPEQFLVDRRYFYGLLDRLPNQPPLRRWLDQKSITLIVDHRDGADQFLAELQRRQSLPLRQLRPGVWRYR